MGRSSRNSDGRAPSLGSWMTIFSRTLDLPTVARFIYRAQSDCRWQSALSQRSAMSRVATRAASAYGQRMPRLLALFWLALSLAVASGPAFALPAANCPMSASSQMQDMHDGMDCCAVTCASECAAICPAGVMPQSGAATAIGPATRQNTPKPTDALVSAHRAGTDPPPRTTIS